jgi:hypothetical protein
VEASRHEDTTKNSRKRVETMGGRIVSAGLAVVNDGR